MRPADRIAVLLIEDNPGDARLVRIALADARFAFDVRHAATLGDAVAELRREPVDVVLLDLSLPDSDGLASLPAIHDVAPQTPLIVLTGLEDEELALRAVRSGAQDYLVKGIDAGSLARGIAHAVERQHMQLELDVARREQLALKDRVLSHVAHELRAPLNAIGGVVMLLTDGLAGDVTASQREYLDVAQQNVAQLARMIHDLLDATRAEAGKLLITAAPLDLASLVEDTLLGLRPLAAAKDVVLDADVPATLPAFADAQRVRQVVTNLVDNAIKFTPSGGRVCVAADVEDDVALVSVADTGCGMPPEALDRIFERLHQEGPGRRHRGLGLGLYICRALVEAQGGRIWAESRPNAGSVFRFTLPRRPRGSLPAPAPSELPAPS